MSQDEKKILHIGEHEGPNDNLDDAVFGAGNSEERFFKGLQAFINVGIGMGDALDRHTEELRRTREKLQRNTPVDYMAIGTGIANASGIALISLGSPDNGTYWEVKHISIGGTDVPVTAAGKAAVYVSGTTNVTGGMLSNRDIAAALPFSNYYGTHQFIVVDQENLLIYVYGGTNGQQYAAVAHLEIFQEAAAQGRATTVN